MYMTPDSVARTPRQMTAEQWLEFGRRQVVYLKAGECNGEMPFMLYGADGALLMAFDTFALRSYSCECGYHFRASESEDTTKCLTCTLDLAHTLGRRHHAHPGQRRACEERARPQDRRGRRDLACGSVGAWPDPRKLRAGASHAGDASPVAHPQATGARAGQPCPAHLEDAGGRQTSSSRRC